MGQPIAVTAGIVLTKRGCNSALAARGGRESKPWLIPAGKLSTAHRAQRMLLIKVALKFNKTRPNKKVALKIDKTRPKF